MADERALFRVGVVLLVLAAGCSGPTPSPSPTLIPVSPTPIVTATEPVTPSPSQPATSPTGSASLSQPPETPTPAPPTTPPPTASPTPTASPALPPFAFAARHGWSLDQANIRPDGVDLGGTLRVDEVQGRAFWYFYNRVDGSNAMACEGELDSQVSPSVLPDRTRNWLSVNDDVGWTRNLCGLQLQPPEDPLPFAWAVSGQPGTTAADDRFVMNDPTTGVLLTWRPIGEGEFAFCALQDEQCLYTGSGRVSYGAYGSYTTKDFFNGMTCENASFVDGADPSFEDGDPIIGVFKHCLYLPLDSL